MRHSNWGHPGNYNAYLINKDAIWFYDEKYNHPKIKFPVRLIFNWKVENIEKIIDFDNKFIKEPTSIKELEGIFNKVRLLI